MRFIFIYLKFYLFKALFNLRLYLNSFKALFIQSLIHSKLYLI